MNIGGISNLTFLPANKTSSLIGYDCGPGNSLLDFWAKKNLHQEYDQDGQWARTGKLHPELLQTLLSDNYFNKTPPKSIGREYFNLSWLSQNMGDLQVAANDVQATLVELTALAITNAVAQYDDCEAIGICGGGVHNTFLMERIRTLCQPWDVVSTSQWGVHPDWIEATAFAWLARQTLHGEPGNLPTVTGAKEQTILGGIYLG